MKKRIGTLTQNWLQPTLYASGNFGKNILWNTSEVLLLFVLTESLGIPAALAGGIILLSLALDALLDPLVGVIAEKSRTPFGQYGPLLLAGAPLSALSFVFLFSLPMLNIRDVWVVGGVLLVFRAGYTLIDVPHNSLLAKASSDSRIRSRIAGLRFVFSSLASLFLALAIAPMVSRSEPLSPYGLFLFACIAASISMAIMLLSWSSVRRADIASGRNVNGAPSLNNLFRSLRRNRNYLIVLALSGVAALTLPLFAKSLLYISRYVLDAPGLASQGLTFMIAGQFAALPFWMWIAQKKENSIALGGSHSWLAMSALGFIVLGVQNNILFLLFCAMVGVAASGIYSVIWAMIADCVEDGQFKSGDRAEATLFAFATLIQKSAIGLGAALFGLGLSLAGHQAGLDASLSVQRTMIGFAAGAPLVGAIICLMLLNLYRLSHAEHEAASRNIETETNA